MKLQNLWRKLLRSNSENEEILLHIAGATVRHANLFEELEVPRDDEELTKEMIEKWVIPFYMIGIAILNESNLRTFAIASKEIDPSVVHKLLSNFNWRTRIVAAFFSAINNYQEFEDVIGKHLLKSEVCYAGEGYCLALASFGTEKSKDYLFRYLEYYLDQKNLDFDQTMAFCALEYLDEHLAAKLQPKWRSFSQNKQYINLASTREDFSKCMMNLEKIRNLK